MKNKKYFFTITRACDHILLKKLNNITISNNSLNLIKGHPFHLKLYNEPKLKKCCNLFIYLFKNLFHLLFSFTKNYSLKKTKKKNFNILVVSSLVNISHLNKKDYIFSDIEAKLRKSNIKFHKLLINHTRFSKDEILSKLKNTSNISVIEFDYTNYISTLKILFNQLKYFFLFLIYFLEEKEKDIKKIFLLSAVEFLNLTTKKNLNLLANFQDFLQNKLFDKLLIPYEGYSWERLILRASKEKMRNLKSYGYHFSAISKFQHSIFRKINKTYDPDYIYTAGHFTKNEFKKRGAKKTEVIGSTRFYSKSAKKLGNKKDMICLVLPEGIKSECFKLFSFSVLAAKKLPEIKFIWRLHPSMTYKEIFSNSSFLSKKELPKNINLSKNSFFQDIQFANMCLYRGSTSSITALQNGVLPIYYNEKNILNIDPLYKLNKWKKSVNDLNDFIKIIDVEKKNMNKNKRDKKIAIDFSLKYFQKLNLNKLIKDLKE